MSCFMWLRLTPTTVDGEKTQHEGVFFHRNNRVGVKWAGILQKTGT